MSNIKLYDWIPFFAEVCCRLVKIGELPTVDERTREMEELSRKVFGNSTRVNPFSFVYTLAAKRSKGNKQVLYKKTKKVMSLNAPVPTDLIFPTPPNVAALMAPKRCIDKLWKTFACVYQARNAKCLSNEQFAELVCTPKFGLSSVTQCIFLINPCCYLPLDEKSALKYLRDRRLGKFADHDTIEKKIKDRKLRFHEDLLEPVRKHFACLKPYEINLFAHLKVVKLTVKKANMKIDEDDNLLVAEIEPYCMEIALIKVLTNKRALLAMICRRLYSCCLRRCRIVDLFRKK